MELISDKMSDLIYVFLDGEASEFERTALFTELSKNPSLQSEFQQAIELNQTFRDDKTGIIIPPSLTGKVFTNLGFTAAGGAIGSTLLNRFADKFAFASKYALTSLVSLAVGAGSYFAINKALNDKTENVVNKDAIVSAEQVSQTAKNDLYNAKNNRNTESSGIAKDNNIKSNNNTTNTVQNIKIVYRNKYIPVYINKESEPSLASNTEKSESPAIAENTASPSNAKSIFEKQNQIKLNNANIDAANYSIGRGSRAPSFRFSPDIQELGSGDIGFSVEIRGLEAIGNYPYRVISPQTSSFMNNKAIRVMVRQDDENSYGIEYGKEALQIYEVDHSGNTALFTQKNNVEYLAATLKHKFTSWTLFDALAPVGEISMGGSKYGAVLKLMAGFQIFGNRYFTSTIGVEGAGFLYQYENKMKSMEKLTFTYGVGINF